MATSSGNGLLQTPELYEYLLESSVYPRESKFLKEIRDVTATHPLSIMGTSPDAGQLITMLLGLISATKTIEIGVFTGYSLLLTALSIPPDGKIVAIDINRDAYEFGLPVIKKAGVEHKINFVESPALSVLDKLLEDVENAGSFDFAFVDADKRNYENYHERLIKLIRIGGLILYDNTLWSGTVAFPEDMCQSEPEHWRVYRKAMVELTGVLAADSRIQMSHVPLGDGLIICKRLI